MVIIISVMNHAWEKSVSEGHGDGVNEQSKMSTQMDLSGTDVLSESIPSSVAHPEKNPLPVGHHSSGSGPQPLILTPASLQLAQLQAQLTLHRLKLAQAATNNNATAATVLNQLLSNVAMSQPFFNQLRTPNLISSAHGQAGGAQLGPGLPTCGLAFPPHSSALGSLVGGGGLSSLNSNSAGIRLNCFRSGLPQPPGHQAAEYGNKAGSMINSLCELRRAASHLPVISQANGGNQGGFQRDFFGLGDQGQPATFTGDQEATDFQSEEHKDQPWQDFSQAVQQNLNTTTAAAREPGRQPPFNVRSELYNPEEPTADPKFHCTIGPSDAQGFEEHHHEKDSYSEGSVPLQPHQLNDFHAVTPAQLPHQCTICEKKVYNLKDWDQHVKGKLHMQNCMLYTKGTSAGSANFPESSQGCLDTSINYTMAYSSTANQDKSTGNNSSYLHATPMTTHPLSGIGYSLPSSGFSPRRPSPGRVVHICNLPEGSCTENDVINLGLPFGKVSNYILMRSTHQAFLEMAYVEAAQAMVKYYQLNPATINEQKLLIRMSKRYKELQLKKPGKDVDSIIQCITSQRERQEEQEIDCYPLDRVRSRSPVSRSLSPRSHSPSFTSCCSTHSPSGPGRINRNNGPGPQCPPWDWSAHSWQDERDEACWRNEDQDLSNGRPQDCRKAYVKAAGSASPQMVEERAECRRGGRDRYARAGPLIPSHRTCKNKEEDFYKDLYKPDKPLKQACQQHEVKAKRRNTLQHHRSQHFELEPPEDPKEARTTEDRKQTSPARVKRKTLDRKQEVEKLVEEVEEKQKEDKSPSPLTAFEGVEPTEFEEDRDREEKDWDSGEETEGETWYPGNMEGLVTVDEVGEVEDSITQLTTEQKGESDEASQDPKKDLVQDEEMYRDGCCVIQPTLQKKADDMLPEDLAKMEQQTGSDLSSFPSPVFQASLDENCASVSTGSTPRQLPCEALSNHRNASGGNKSIDRVLDGETGSVLLEINEAHDKDENPDERKDVHSTSLGPTSRLLGVEVMTVHSPSQEQEKVLNEQNIPLGVEFIVPRSGFYCKLCGLFYTSEEKARTVHCRSTVHYKNLQKYLSQLAVESMQQQTLLTSPETSL